MSFGVDKYIRFHNHWFTMVDSFVTVAHDHSRSISNKTALVDEFGSYTYQELDRLSNGVAAKLIGQGIGTGDIVPILMTRSKAFVAAFIGVMKSGAAFVPLDINYPEGRIKSIEESVEARIVIDDEWMKDVSPSDEYVNNSKTDDIAFIIFTSGSTGKPKGVVHTHKSASAMANASIESCKLNKEYNYSTILNCNFIGGMHNYISYLSVGATVFIAPDNIRKDAQGLSDWLRKNKIDAIHCNPSYAKILLEKYDLPLKVAHLGSERMFPINRSSAKIIHSYGCSEFTPPALINLDVQLNEVASPGKPSYGVDEFIVKDDGSLAKDEEIGELCLAGPQMASGYWKMPELTAEKFVHCPFLPGDVKMYKTGDLARYREDGNIELVGRKDFQIKIRGFRIEPGEIENVAVKFDGIDTAVVVAKEMGAEKQLILYYTSNAQVDEKRLKEYLSKYLADYMVPNFYVCLDEMPRNVNGKIDRSALPEPQMLSGSEKVSDKPSTEFERIIFNAVAKQIGTEDFGINDDLISLGLTSLSSMIVAAEIESKGVGLSASKQGVSFYNEIVLARNIKELVKRLNSEG